MNKYFYRFMIIVLLTFVGVGILGSGQVFASGGSFNVPQVNDHFEKVKQGPAPTKEPSLTHAPQKEHGSWDWITKPISKGWNWTKEKVSSAWKWMKETADSEWKKAMNGDWLAGILAIILITSIVITSFNIGVLRGLWDTVKGIGYMIIHPIKTIEGIIDAFSHPVETGKAVWKFISESFKRDVINGDASSRAEWAGYVVGSLVGAKGVDKLGKLSKAGMLSKISKVSRASKMGQLGRIGKGINLIQKGARKLHIPQTVSKIRSGLSKLGNLIRMNKVAASVITVVSLTTGLLALDPEAVIQAFNKITVTSEKFEVKTAFKNAEKCFGYQPTPKYFATINPPGSGIFDCLYRSDNDFYSKTRPSQKGNPVGKAYIDKETGDLYPADINGDITITDHILNQNKSKSPFISVTPNKTNDVIYGENQIEIDFKSLQRDIKDGKLKGVEIYFQDDIIKDLQNSLREKEKEYQDYLSRGGQSQKRIEKYERQLSFLQTAITNTKRDNEILIKGVVPSKYIKGPYKVK